MIKRKKAVSLMMVAGMVVSLAACGNGGTKETDASKGTTDTGSGDLELKTINTIELGTVLIRRSAVRVICYISYLNNLKIIKSEGVQY